MAGKAVNWTEIARGLTNRSNKDCRKRYIKVFADRESNRPRSNSRQVSPQFSKGAWQEAEDNRLRQAVKKHPGK